MGGRDTREEWPDGRVVVREWNVRWVDGEKERRGGTDRSTRGFEKTHQVHLIGPISRFLSFTPRIGLLPHASLGRLTVLSRSPMEWVSQV